MSENKYILMDSMELIGDDVLEKAMRGLERAKTRKIIKRACIGAAGAAAAVSLCFAVPFIAGQYGKIQAEQSAAETGAVSAASSQDTAESETKRPAAQYEPAYTGEEPIILPCETVVDENFSGEPSLYDRKCVNIDGRCYESISDAVFMRYRDEDERQLKSFYPELTYGTLLSLPLIGEGYIYDSCALNDFRICADGSDEKHEFYRLDNDRVVMRMYDFVGLKEVWDVPLDGVADDLIAYIAFEYSESKTALAKAAGLLYPDGVGRNAVGVGIRELKIVKYYKPEAVGCYIEAWLEDNSEADTLYERLAENGIDKEYVQLAEVPDYTGLLAEISFIPPVEGGMIYEPSELSGGYAGHKGVDIVSDGGEGTPILAAADGTVTFADWQNGNGQFIRIEHENGYETTYSHCSELYVTEGQRVTQGETIAAMGATGWAEDVHLHFEILRGGENISPELFINMKYAVGYEPRPVLYPPIGLITPVSAESAEISARYGGDEGTGSFHSGTDYAADEGAPVLASADGIVKEAVTEYGAGDDDGIYIVIEHADGYETVYSHCSELFVTAGQQVKQGDIIAAVGSTGRSTGPHLHFELRYYGKSVDPSEFMTE